MSLIENTRRAFGTDNDYAEAEEMNDSRKKPNVFKRYFNDLFGRTDEFEGYDDDAVEEEPKYSRTERKFSSEPRASRFSRTNDSYSEAPIRDNGAGIEIITMYPKVVDDATKLIQEVKRGKIVIFDVNDQPESAEEARRIVDFMGGAAEGLDCPFSRLCASIFCIAPVGVKFTNTKTRYTR